MLTALVSFLLAVQSAAAPALDFFDGTFRVYMSPTGSDADDGATPSTAVQTLDRAEEVIAAKDPDADVEVRIAPGTYTAEPTRWNTYVDGHTISFVPESYDGSGKPERPVFESDGSDGYWFWAELPAGHGGGDTNLEFQYLEVRGYSTGGLAIVGPTHIEGDYRVPDGAGMNGNTVYGMKFTHVGSKYNDGSTGYGGLVMWNSNHNVVRNNHFLHNENLEHEHNLIHGVYLSHGSSHNVIEDNKFDRITGHPMNVRNSSNFNTIRDNVFERTGYPGGGYFSDWSCGKECVEKHPGHPREKPSHGNEFIHNTLKSSYDGGHLPAFTFYPEGLDLGAGSGSGSGSGGDRLRTDGNQRPN